MERMILGDLVKRCEQYERETERVREQLEKEGRRPVELRGEYDQERTTTRSLREECVAMLSKMDKYLESSSERERERQCGEVQTVLRDELSVAEVGTEDAWKDHA
eukprot:79481-Amphidinium_carterae.1